MSRHLWQIISLIFGISISPLMYAEADAEREALARIIHELQVIESMVDKAQAQSEKRYPHPVSVSVAAPGSQTN